MKRVCAWCLQEMGVVEGNAHPDTEVSHGICGRCEDNFEFQQGVTLQRFLDSLPTPVLAVDGFVIVKAANRAASEALGKDPREIIQHLGGNVFECAHARLPQGCGRTIHCSGCVIRRSVVRTYETGEPQVNVPATLRRGDPDHPDTVALRITTIKTGDVVMLRVDSWTGPMSPDLSSTGGPNVR